MAQSAGEHKGLSLEQIPHLGLGLGKVDPRFLQPVDQMLSLMGVESTDAG